MADQRQFKDFKEQKKDYRHIVRIASTDLDGSKPIYHALNKIKGVSFMFANALCKFADIEMTKITGQLNEAEIQRLNETLADPLKYGFPAWMLNRRKDVETGVDKHLLGSDLRFVVDNDMKLMKKIRSYKGVRHMMGLTVRGQRTKSNFRKKKGTGLGVIRKATAPAPAGGGDKGKK
jgi:small subunit ribosomal protein S13